MKKKTKDGLKILQSRYLKGKPRRQALMTRVSFDSAVARKIFEVRTEAGLSQRALAKMLGTTASVICRLEDADYHGHSLSMLQRIAAALNRELEINFKTKQIAA